MAFKVCDEVKCGHAEARTIQQQRNTNRREKIPEMEMKAAKKSDSVLLPSQKTWHLWIEIY